MTCKQRTEHRYRSVPLDELEELLNTLEREGFDIEDFEELEPVDEAIDVPRARVWATKTVCACADVRSRSRTTRGG